MRKNRLGEIQEQPPRPPTVLASFRRPCSGPDIMPTMQPEAISALVASGAAILGVPAALIVGLRQARAARHAAEVASQAAHEQWRGNTRREAAIAFVLAAEQQLETIRAIRTADVPSDLDRVTQMRRDLLKSLALLRIEGPEPLAEQAARVWATLNSVTLDVVGAHRRLTPILILRAAAEQGDETAKMVLNQIGRKRNDPVPRAVWAALRESQLLSPRDAKRLAWRARPDGAGFRPSTRPVVSFGDAYTQVRKELDEFSVAVREELDTPTAALPSRRPGIDERNRPGELPAAA